jgi:hypothetical protein
MNTYLSVSTPKQGTIISAGEKISTSHTCACGENRRTKLFERRGTRHHLESFRSDPQFIKHYPLTMKLAIATLLCGSAAAFSPAAPVGARSSVLSMAETATEPAKVRKCQEGTLKD